MFRLLIAASFLVSAMSLAQAQHTPYAGFQQRSIKALSEWGWRLQPN